ncbi:MAG TPA: HAD-IC family P-type ATPase [Candidatus Limnocylindrales bacterium]
MAPDPDLSQAHALSPAAVAAALAVEPSRGLAGDVAAARLLEHGPNELEAPRRPSPARLLVDAVSEPFVLLLLGAGLLAVALGEVRDGLLVLFGLVPIVGADVITTYRGERALEALRASAAPVARVRRDGAPADVPAATIVPGDIVLLGVGDIAPADIRLTHADSLLVDRSVLTGESLPEPAQVAADQPTAALVERRAMVYSGTSVVQGRAEGIAVATGARSELGRIAAALGGEARRRSPLQRELDRLVRILLSVAIGLIAITGGLALWRGEPLGVALLAGIAAAIAAIPEEPPVLLAVILGLGAYRLLRRRVLVRRLSAQETLGAVDLILTDKTGTLTRNELSLEQLLTPTGELDGAPRRAAIAAAYRAQEDAWHRAAGARAGSFTAALERALGEYGGAPALALADRLVCEPLRDGQPYSRVRCAVDGGEQELLLGAPEAVLARLADEAGPAAATQADLAPWHDLVAANAAAGRRLLLLAAGGGADALGGAAGEGLAPVALLAFTDPLRADVPAALATAESAGIQTVLVTGDHPLTAQRIADAAGLAPGTVISGEQLDGWDDARLDRELAGLRVVARAVPEQKLRLVEAARRMGRTVAVTGDGVNDAPALEHADVAVAMGSGTAVAREAADLVLGDDSFATLMGGLREGRRMVANVQKGLVFLVSTHVALLGFILIATLYGFSQPLLPIQILWLELFIDISASIAYEREPEEPQAMQQPPRRRDRPLLDRPLLLRIALAGGFTALAALGVMVGAGARPAAAAGGVDTNLDAARWLAFNVLVVGQVVRAYANRSLVTPVLRLRRNGVLLGAVLVALAVQLAIPYVPPLAEAFHAVPLDGAQWLVVLAIALVPALLAEVMRALRRREWVA